MKNMAWIMSNSLLSSQVDLVAPLPHCYSSSGWVVWSFLKHSNTLMAPAEWDLSPECSPALWHWTHHFPGVSFLFLLLFFFCLGFIVFQTVCFKKRLKVNLAFTTVVSRMELASSSITQLVQINTILVYSVELYASHSSYKLGLVSPVTVMGENKEYQWNSIVSWIALLEKISFSASSHLSSLFFFSFFSFSFFSLNYYPHPIALNHSENIGVIFCYSILTAVIPCVQRCKLIRFLWHLLFNNCRGLSNSFRQEGKKRLPEC